MMRASRPTTPAGAAAAVRAPAQIVLSYRVPETGAVELGGNGMVLRMQERLQRDGYLVFVGEASLTAGDSWDDMIQGAIERSSVFIALCSPTYGQTAWTKRELQLADSDQKVIIPVWINGDYPPRGVRMYLLGKQRLPQGDRPMMDVDFETAMLELGACIQRAGCYPGGRSMERPVTASRQQLPKLSATSFRSSLSSYSNAAGPGRALLLASKVGELNSVELQLRSSSINPNVQDKNGATSLQAASRAGHAEVAALLLASGALVDAQDTDGVTPLQVAITEGHAKVAQVLLQAGAAINVFDDARDRVCCVPETGGYVMSD
ncbi:Ankyrin repeat domain-containing protein [Tetrabaena socialis]|uniref:Ankyrin repeat domain-containing protein n=1 Tax=Tetrabaena socialis TaxID=47790 RepID=A0A2J7ZYQ4_9CHLO|nr:Ankyrin repeat domain-containing protein [Tetrabaena socialis]|eukprot:PNH05403.1 Ankyrin repeat domain-containing protein [Tetrabaena socialis]